MKRWRVVWWGVPCLALGFAVRAWRTPAAPSCYVLLRERVATSAPQDWAALEPLLAPSRALGPGQTAACVSAALEASLGKQAGPERQRLLGHAIWAARHCVTSDDNNADCHSSLGHALFNSGQDQAALYHFRRALELRPGRADLYVGPARLLLVYARLEEAEQALRQGLSGTSKRNPSTTRALLLDLAQVLSAKRRFEDSAAALSEALALTEQQPKAPLLETLVDVLLAETPPDRSRALVALQQLAEEECQAPADADQERCARAKQRLSSWESDGPRERPSSP